MVTDDVGGRWRAVSFRACAAAFRTGDMTTAAIDAIVRRFSSRLFPLQRRLPLYDHLGSKRIK